MHPKELLDLGQVLKAYRTSEKRIFFLDYDGTLAPLVDHPDAASPSETVCRILKALCEDPRNFVYIISGREKDCLQKWLGGVGVGFSAEHGSFFRPMPREYPGSKELGADAIPWEDMSAEMGVDFSWKDDIISRMREYCKKCPGSEIEQKVYTIVWHYRNAESPFADAQAGELFKTLHGMENNGVVGKKFQVIAGSKNIEVRPAGITKGIVVQKILDNPQHANADFLLSVGDDTTDEDMFPPLNKHLPNAFTIRVGNAFTAATNFVERQDDVVQLLGLLANSASRTPPPNH